MGSIYRVRRSQLATYTPSDQIIDPDSDAHKNSTAFDPSEIKPNPQIRTNRRFREPPTLLSDWRNNLMEDKPFVNYTYELIHDWYARQQEGYEKIFVRAQQTPIDWKSKIGNSDMSTNFKTTHETMIYKGDIVIREDGIIAMINWNVTNHANNQASQIVECNDYLTFTREAHPATDDDGFIIGEVPPDKDLPREVIVKDMPCNHTEYAGRPDFSTTEGQPGILGDNLITISMQFNSETSKIRIGDHVEIGYYTYRVINVSTAEINITKKFGIITCNAKRVAGGGLVG